MTRLRTFVFRLSALLRSRQMDRDIDDEIASHLAEATDEYLRQGLSPEDARRAARRSFGGVMQTREVYREVRSFMWLDDVTRDLRHAFRTLRRAPVFTAVALLTVALGIGANTAMFTIVNAVLLRPLDYPRPEALMYVTTQFPLLGVEQGPLSAPEYFELREVNQSFAALGAFSTGAGDVNLTGHDGARRVRNANVDEHLLNALGLQAAHGRLFGRGETDRPSLDALPPALAILSHELWQSAFGGQPIVGQMVEVNGRPREVIGIMPPGADVMDIRPEIWLPLGLTPSTRANRRGHGLRVIGRLKDHVTVEAAQTELKTLNEQWAERVGVSDHMFTPMPTGGAAARPANPDAGHILQMGSLHNQIVGAASRAIWMLQATGGLVLLIACANLANLVLARAAIRRREFAVRTALGASRGRLLRQFMTEGALLSIVGGALALWLARLGLRTLTHAFPAALPRSTGVSVDAPVLLFAGGVAIATTMFFGLAHLRHVGLKGLAVTLTEAGAKGGSGTRRHVRRGLVVAEVALAVILVIGAGLLIRTVYNLANVDAGFDRSRLVTFSINLPESTYPSPGARVQAFQRLLDALGAVPGVEATTAMFGLPPNRPAGKNSTRIADTTVPAVGQFVDYNQYVMPDYFETMGIPIVSGRSFQPTDATSSGLVAIVNERFADTFWKGRDPIGQRVRPCCNDQFPWFTVVGVAKDVKQGGVDQETGTELYIAVQQIARLPAGMATAPLNHVVLRSTLAPAALSHTIERVVREIDRAVPVVRLRDMEAVFAESIQGPRFLAQLLGLFAGLALLLAAVGTYGVISSLVAERRREIGIRMALGAERSRVLAEVMKEGLILAGVGVVVGLGAASGLSRLVEKLLFGVQPTDAPTVAGVAATMIVVAAVACFLPAWRASRLDPNAILRA